MRTVLVTPLSCFVLMASAAAFPGPASNIHLPLLFTDNMVLQQKMEIPVWGTADPGGLVIVELDKAVKKTTVLTDGHWRVDLPSAKAGGPYELRIIGNDTITFKNVMVGEVWLCSGQSNMAWSVAALDTAFDTPKEIAGADFPNLRIFDVGHETSASPSEKGAGSGWKICSPATIGSFSAVAYFFGKHLHEKLGLPIGLINSSFGGTIIEAWTSAGSLKQFPEYAEIIQSLEKYAANDTAFLRSYQAAQDEWKLSFNHTDPGLPNDGETFKDFELDVAQWKTMVLPCQWSGDGLESFDGAVWFRKDVTLPDTWAGKSLRVNLGPIDDIDVTWFNGDKVGSLDLWDQPRFYDVPGSIVKAGRNVIAVRVLDTGGPGGIWGKPEELALISEAQDSLSLAGEWLYRVGLARKDIPQRPFTVANQNCPTVLYNGMIAPLVPYSLRGVIWYQGESNAWDAHRYRELFPAMIRDWRHSWQQGDFPFLFVQLANYQEPYPEPRDDDWAELREAQTMTLAVKNTGMAVTIDIGDAKDIHPKNKREVGNRLALAARSKVYGEKITYSGPTYKTMKIERDKIRLWFDYAGHGLTTKGGSELKGFAIAGTDKKFHYAQAKIDGNTVVVWHPEVPAPAAVRYAWAINPICNLYNSTGLPASPFRTDSWPGITK